MWTVMMVAMMFPTAAPYILTFHGVQVGKRQRGQAFVATWIFVAVYLVVWIAFGAVAYMLAVQAQTLAGAMRWPGDTVARIGGVLIILAGLYQLSPLKGLCLSKCRSPLSFILTSWRDGVGGAIRMGLQHASYCLGCCWLLFVILFPIGVMNIAAMVLITALIFAEKALPHGHRVAVLAAVGLVVYGIVVIAAPQALPTFMPSASMEDMPAPHALP
jgi:predicted metal-binding membrane protein